MFACLLYPTDKNVLNSVKEEVRYQASQSVTYSYHTLKLFSSFLASFCNIKSFHDRNFPNSNKMTNKTLFARESASHGWNYN